MKGWKKIFHPNRDQKKAGVSILISDKIDFIKKGCEKRQRRTLHNDQRSIQEEDITIINICTQHRSTTICKTNANKYERGN